MRGERERDEMIEFIVRKTKYNYSKQIQTERSSVYSCEHSRKMDGSKRSQFGGVEFLSHAEVSGSSYGSSG